MPKNFCHSITIITSLKAF